MRRKRKKAAAQTRAKPKKPSRLRLWSAGVNDRSGRPAVRPLLWIAAVLALAGGAAAGFKALERSVLTAGGPGAPARIRIAFSKQPDWMPGGLVRRVSASLVPKRVNFRDNALTAEVHHRAEVNPWVRRVHGVTKRVTDDPELGLLEVHAEFRRPIACVNVNGRYEYFDVKGWRLPADQVPQWVVMESGRSAGVPGGTPKARLPRGLKQDCYLDRLEVPPGVRAERIHYITIAGVDRTRAPLPAVGRPWDAPDLLEGLKLAQLLCTRWYANQISVVDVRNHAGRISKTEPYLRMYAQVGRSRTTDIRFGRFPAPGGGDYVVSPERKMSYLDGYYEDHGGRLAGINTYIDLRYDQLHVSLR